MPCLGGPVYGGCRPDSGYLADPLAEVETANEVIVFDLHQRRRIRSTDPGGWWIGLVEQARPRVIATVSFDLGLNVGPLPVELRDGRDQHFRVGVGWIAKDLVCGAHFHGRRRGAE